MHVAFARGAPPHELDGQLEGRLRGADEGVLVDPERLVEHADLGDRRLAHADGSDLFGFDKRDGETGIKKMAKSRCCHPACGATACDDDAHGPRAHGA